MPFVTIYLQKGCNDAAIVKSMREITEAGASTLENTLTRMVRVSVFEAEEARVYQGGIPVTGATPTIIFNVGPGRSQEAKNLFMAQIAEILELNLGISKESVRAYIMDNGNPDNFCIGGQLKDFSKKVK